MNRITLLTLISFFLYLSTSAQDPYGFMDTAVPSTEFSEEELKNLETLRAEYASLGPRISIFTQGDSQVRYNLFLDSVGIGPDSRSIKGNQLVPVHYPWIAKMGFEHLGILNNNWSGRALNPNLIYATKRNTYFYIFDKSGQELFSYVRYDTTNNGTVREYHASYFFLDYTREIGCFILQRGPYHSLAREFRIYDLRGKPMTSWKRREGERDVLNWQNIDPYFLGYIQRQPESSKVELITYQGDTLIALDSGEWRYRAALPELGMYQFVDHKLKKGYLVNFTGKKAEVGYRQLYAYVLLDSLKIKFLREEEIDELPLRDGVEPNR